MVNAQRFLSLTQLVIDKFEGGYFHPDMMKDGRLKYDPDLATSGETMFGIDRKNGTALAKYPEWKPFWAMIDKAGAKRSIKNGGWKWNYRGGNLEIPLRDLAAKMMYPWFTSLFTKYLTPAAQQLVANNDSLIIHFSYAAWNGPGWFEIFAKKFNALVKQSTNDLFLTNGALKHRTDSSSSLIRQSGNKMVKVVNDLQKKNPK